MRSQSFRNRLLDSCPSVHPSSMNNSVPTGWIFKKKKFLYLRIFRKSVENIRGSLKSDKHSGTLHEDRCTFLTISRLILLRMRNFSDKRCRENRNTHFVFNNTFFFKSCLLYEMMWKTVVEPETGKTADGNTIRCMRLTCWIRLQTHTQNV